MAAQKHSKSLLALAFGLVAPTETARKGVEVATKKIDRHAIGLCDVSYCFVS